MCAQDYRVKTKALALHNEYRADHGVEPLQWSYELQKAAREHAVYLASRSDGKPLLEKEDVTWGQNIFQVQRRPTDSDSDQVEELSETDAVERAMKSWYDDLKLYNWADPPGNSDALSATQIIWRSTEKVGVGVGRNGAGDRVVVCAFYSPGGNFRGEFQNNVQPKNVSLTDPTPWRTKTSTSTTNSITTNGDRKKSLSPSPAPAPIKSFASLTLKDKNSNTTSPKIDPEKIGPVPKVLTIAVELHNSYRKKHRAPLLQLDARLCLQAQSYAQSIVDGTQSTMEPTNVGRNAFRYAGSLGSVDSFEIIKKAVNKWYDGQKEYNWSAPLASGSNAKLFSALIWKGSKDIGVGIATANDMVAIVAMYSPMGNQNSDQSFRENVRPAVY